MATPAVADATSRRLGRYELIAEIARGGMGTVLLARLAGAGGFQRLSAIKLLHQHYATDHEFVQMLLDEARIAARLHHPNVVSIHEVEQSPEHGYYVVMDYVEGFPLSDLASVARSLPWKARARIAIRVVLDALLGLEAAHTLTDDDGKPLFVVHRDVSPQNILVGTNGIARVTDFGIAKAAARMSSTRIGQVKGKLAYMSPEQARGKPTDARTDLWAIGVVLWEVIAARRLFRVENESETYQRVLTAPIPRLNEVVPESPGPLTEFVARSLERDANQRFPSARQMASTLEMVARGLDLLADAHEIGNWIRTTFAGELSLRREAIKKAATGTISSGGQKLASLPGGLEVPQLPEESVSLSVTMAPGPPDEGSFEEHSTTTEFDALDTVVRTETSDVTRVDELDEVSTHRNNESMAFSLKKALATLEERQGPNSEVPIALVPPRSAPAHAGSPALRAPTLPVAHDPARARSPIAPASAPASNRSRGVTVAIFLAALVIGPIVGYLIFRRGSPGTPTESPPAPNSVPHGAIVQPATVQPATVHPASAPPAIAPPAPPVAPAAIPTPDATQNAAGAATDPTAPAADPSATSDAGESSHEHHHHHHHDQGASP